jgi:predicted 2-oxoglutarate/Fe(II)-dependent dioxygenase YbiX
MSSPDPIPSDPAVGSAPAFKQLMPGDHLPSMRGECGDNPKFAFDTIAGRYQLYGFFLSVDKPEILNALQALASRRDLFDDRHCSFTGVSTRDADRQIPGLANAEPGVRIAWDIDLSMSRACGAVPLDAAEGEPMTVNRKWVLVDPSLHVLRVYPMLTTPVEEVLADIAALPTPDRFGGVGRPAPVLMLPNVLAPDLCQRLIAAYDTDGGKESGVYRAGGHVMDAAFKRRRDFTIEDPKLLSELRWSIARRVLPEIEKLFFMNVRYIERHIVGCYSAEHGGLFSPHTDNGPGLTAHRRFAVSVNLSADFDGGEVVFPEYNTTGYKAPPGWAVVFPCAILHAVNPVRRGARYAYLPFVYDEAGERIREENLRAAGILDA